MSRPTTRKLGLAAVLALAFSGATIGVAGATNTVEIDSQIVLRESFPAFHGKVKSSNAGLHAGPAGEGVQEEAQRRAQAARQDADATSTASGR